MDKIPRDKRFLGLKGPNIIESVFEVVSAFIDDDLDLIQLFTDQSDMCRTQNAQQWKVLSASLK
jgi:hypothetical protein